jgi:hypothetical protein
MAGTSPAMTEKFTHFRRLQSHSVDIDIDQCPGARLWLKLTATGGLWGSNPMTGGRQSGISEVIRGGILAGAAGGLAEIIWVSLYAMVTGANPATMARAVTTAAGVTALLPAAPVTMGIAVHMMLAIMLGVALAGLWQTLVRTRGVSCLYGVALAVLAAVWAVNFFVILPVISPAFVHLVPYSVSLMSKLLFALAAAETLRRCVFADEARVPARVLAAKKHPAA